MSSKQVLWPDWRVERLIGRGSFASVYEIRREIPGAIEKAALKVISIPQNDSDVEELYSEGYDNESITSTFRSHLESIVGEYALMKNMSGCTNIVNCHDIRYAPHSDGIGWDIMIKMDLLTPLASMLPETIPENLVIKIAKDLCMALILCSEENIVHRDIKPQNIFVSDHGDFKLGDFGIAKTIERTAGGTRIGTYKYMAPEVYHNQPYGASADLYSLGLVLYWLLNERRMPFMALPPKKLKAGEEEYARNRRLSGEPLPPPAHGSQTLKDIVLQACAFDPRDRFQSPKAMLNALIDLEREPHIDRRSNDSTPMTDYFKAPDPLSEDPSPIKPEKPAKKRKSPLIIAIVLFLAALSVLLSLLFFGNQPKGERSMDEEDTKSTSDATPLFPNVTASNKNGWEADGKKWVYYENGVKVQDRWIEVGGKYYYLDANGYRTTDSWLNSSDGWVYLGPDGIMITNAWVKASKGWCYVGQDGVMVTNDWVEDSKGRCYVGEDGYCLTNCWVEDDAGWIWLDAEGSTTKNTWVRHDGKWYFVDENGYMVTNCWKENEKGWHYLGERGYCLTNCWIEDGIGWIWLDNEGNMIKNAWHKNDGKWYWLDENGYMIRNTSKQIGEIIYYFDADGVCTNP